MSHFLVHVSIFEKRVFQECRQYSRFEQACFESPVQAITVRKSCFPSMRRGQEFPLSQKVLYGVRINNFAFSTCLTGAKDSEQRYPRVLCCLQFDIFAFSTCLTGARHSGQCYPESRWRPGGGGLSPASSRSAPGVFRDCSGTVPECSGVAPPIKQLSVPLRWRHFPESLRLRCYDSLTDLLRRLSVPLCW